MAPEVKEYADYLTALIGASGIGGVVIAIFGWMAARNSHVEPEAATVGAKGVAQIGALILDDAVGNQAVAAIDRLTLALTSAVTTRTEEIAQAKKRGEELHDDMRDLTGELRELARRIGHSHN